MSTPYQFLQEHGRAQPERTAVSQRRLDGSFEPTTYRHLAAAARRFAVAFHAQLPPGQIVPMCLARSADCMAAMIGALGAGHAFSCLTQKLRPPQIERVLTTTKAPVALIDAAGLLALKGGIVADSPIARTRWWLIRGPGFGPSHQRLADQLAAVARVETWNPEAWDGPFAPPTCDPQSLGCCLFTSGSTGNPKGVLISREDLRARAEAEVHWFGLSKDDILLGILPFSFDVGLNQLLSAVSVGCELVLLDSWFPRDILKTVEARKVTGISAVPSIWIDFMTNRLSFQTDGAHATLRYFTVSGGDMSRKHLEQLPGLAPCVGIFKTYGQTEAFRASSLKPHEFATRPTSVGRPFHGVRLYIVKDDGTRAAANEQGEVVHTGLGVMLGYLGGNDPQNKLRPNPFAGPDDPAPTAIFTGDLGRLDDEGYLFLTGRRDDMIKISGYRVYPGEIREQLLAVSGVLHAEVVAVKGEEQTRLAAFVIGDPSAGLTDLAVRTQLGTRVPSYMVPELVVFKSELPRTASGKPDRPLLAAEAQELLKKVSPRPV